MFHDLLLGPLSKLVGEDLLSLEYVVLPSLLGAFDPAAPNDCGLLAVGLNFRSESAWLSWQKLPHNDVGLAYGLRSFPRLEQIFDGQVCRISADGTQAWLHCIGSPLQRFSIYGQDGFSFAVLLQFGGCEVAVATGYAGRPPDIGDGDDVLVATKKEFDDLRSASFRKLLKISSH